MSFVKLSGRMERLASKVTEGNRLADVGTDHGYIPIALVQRNQIPSAIAMDVNQGPLRRAKEHIQAYGLDTYIETRLSDGLEKLGTGEADTVLIAGMGGALTAKILGGGTHCLDTVQELILQPQSEISLVRSWLSSHGFRIQEEDTVRDEGKYYFIMRAVHGRQHLDEAELAYGKTDVQCSPGLLTEYLREKLEKNRSISGILKRSGKEDSIRMKELVEDTDRIHQILAGMMEFPAHHILKEERFVYEMQ